MGGREMAVWILLGILMALAAVPGTDGSLYGKEQNDASDCEHNDHKELSGSAGNRTDEGSDKLEDNAAGRWRRVKIRHKRLTAIVGIACQENIDCQTTNGGAYCDTTKRCDCMPAYVNLNGFCWAKRNPGDTCQYLEQCTSVSPNTYCDTSGVCRCTNNQPAFRAPDGDGPFCLLPGECPSNGPNSKLRDPDTGTPVRCQGEGTLSCRDKDLATGPNDAMYHCICSNPTDDVLGFPCALTEQAYCCPSRAAACIQSKDEGTFGGGTPQQRWWYNSATSSCEWLSYRGNGGNGNNFFSKALCESYCKTICPRGSALSMSTGCSVTSNTNCGGNTDFFCNTDLKVMTNLCCPRSSFVCSPSGGLILTPTNMPDPGDRSYNIPEVNRWYYDSSARTCRMFSFRGYGGTFNNFHTEAECRMYCSSAECTAGEPLRDSGGIVVICSSGGTGVCPLKYECSASGLCCPSVNFVCSQPQAIGACSSFMERWWFNPSARTCEKFFYSGCQGNYNNFATYQACSDYCTASAAKPICPQGEAAKDGTGYVVCSGAGLSSTACPSDYYCHFDGTRYGCCPTRTKTCQVDVQDPGTNCLTPVTRWYYNVQTRACETFTYNGCDGNSNNFATKIDCQDYCGVGGCSEGGEPFRDSASSTYRVCGNAGADCPLGYTCSVVTLGTSNRFNYCCPTRASVCTSMAMDPGQRCGANTLTRYYFNVATRTCEAFEYNGCGGNRNNFAAVSQCLTYCNSAGCPAGQVASQDPISKLVTLCDISQGNGCQTNYKCTFSRVLQQGVCCGSSAPVGSCPAGQIAFMDSFTNTVLQCQPNVDNSCPMGIFCQFNFALNNAFCCGNLAAQCPQGGDPYTETVGGQARQCTPGLPNVCPQGYTCQATTVVVGSITSSTGYCCGQGNICGSGYAPYYVNNQPVPCVSNQMPGVCPAPFTCRQSVNSQQAYCCSPSGQMTPVCAIGKQPWINLGAPTLCTQNSPSTGCPAGYTCDLYAAAGSFYCCRFGNDPFVPSGAVCPTFYFPLQPIRTCSPGVPGSCPVNYFCNFDQANSRYVCCGAGPNPPTSGYCPINSQPYSNPATGQPLVCTLGSPATGCPAIGYRCSYSSTFRNYYCCTAGGSPIGQYGCPFGTAYLYPGTRTPLACRQAGSPCPLGYSCQQSTINTSQMQCCSNVGRQAAGIEINGPAAATPAPPRNPIVTTRPTVPSARKCSSNYDCRDQNGKPRLCVQGQCVQ